MNDAPQTSWSAELAAFAAGLRYEDIPDPVVDRAVDLFVDWVGSALAGKGMRPIEIVSSFARTMGPESGPSEILIDGSSSSPLFAAFVNGASSHIAEQDDVHNDEGFRVPAGVRKPPMQEPAGHSRSLWGFRFSADVGDGVTAARKRRDRRERTAP